MENWWELDTCVNELRGAVTEMLARQRQPQYADLVEVLDTHARLLANYTAQVASRLPPLPAAQPQPVAAQPQPGASDFADLGPAPSTYSDLPSQVTNSQPLGDA